jgi:hypothetical protein
MHTAGDDPVDPPDRRCQKARLASDMDLDLGEILGRQIVDRKLRGDRDGILMECDTNPLG